MGLHGILFHPILHIKLIFLNPLGMMEKADLLLYALVLAGFPGKRDQSNSYQFVLWLAAILLRAW